MHLNPALVTTVVVLLTSVPLYKCAVATNLIRLLVMTSLCMLPIAMQTTADANMLCRDPPPHGTHPDVRATCRKKRLTLL